MSALFAAQLLQLLAALALLYYLGLLRRIREKAQGILDTARKGFTEFRDLRTLDAAGLPPQTAGKLDEARRLLGPLGLRYLCDVEDRTFTQANHILIPIRYFTEERCEILAAVYFHPALGYVVFDFMTDLSDGRHLTTSNATMAGKILAPPTDLREFLPPASEPADLLAQHRAWLAEVLASSSGRVRPGTPGTPGQVLDRYQRMNREKWEFHRDRGWITLEELRKMAPGNSETIARRVHTEIQKILRKERKQAR